MNDFSVGDLVQVMHYNPEECFKKCGIVFRINENIVEVFVCGKKRKYIMPSSLRKIA